jgi:tetratricopeptide (TPR) repeat protein
MNDYEFWNELGKIFNAVVAYQEKAVEFNNRFINPWIRLGNVFDKQDRNQESIRAYEKALELDPANAQNWYELGNLYFREKDYEKAVEAYNKAIEFAPQSGWAYNNLALTLVSQGKYAEALPLYQKGVDLIDADKDKAIVWNRIGNVYRKLNEYDLAVQSFHRADELDAENAGFRDELDDVPESTVPVQSNPDQDLEQKSTENLNPIQLILSESQAEDKALAEADNLPDIVALSDANAAEFSSSEEITQNVEQVTLESAIAQDENAEDKNGLEIVGQPDNDDAAENNLSVDQPDQELIGNQQTSTAIVRESNETYTEIPETVAVTTTDTTKVVIRAEETNVETSEEEDDLSVAGSEVNENVADESSVMKVELDIEDETESNDSNAAEQSAYEVFLKENQDFVVKSEGEPEDSMPEALQEPAAFVDSSGDLQIEMDTKNAHVWNELGNIYFNTGAYDDAIVAYSKAIQLDRCFAWPYSNLALTYVQKGRFTEAILLYQRSIELFTSEKDKAISWNRLGNVYRRLNNYDSAIAAYQRADELDPENTTLSLQSRFSLLGNYPVEQQSSYISG